MKRRIITRSLMCSEPGCKESVFWELHSQREYVEHQQKYPTWKCLRHEHPARVLSAANPRTEWVSLPTGKAPGCKLNKEMYFGSTGLLSGNGYIAFSSDFPPGTRIRVVAEVIFPNQKELTE